MTMTTEQQGIDALIAHKTLLCRVISV